MSAMCVQTWLRKWRSCETTITVLSYSSRKLLEPADGGDVEMVGRLVEKQDVGVAEERLSEKDFDLLVVPELAHFLFVKLGSDSQAREQDRGVALGFPAAQLGEKAFELAGAHAVGFGEFGFGVEALLSRR